MVVSNRNLLFQGSIFRGYVSFREGIIINLQQNYQLPYSSMWNKASNLRSEDRRVDQDGVEGTTLWPVSCECLEVKGKFPRKISRWNGEAYVDVCFVGSDGTMIEFHPLQVYPMRKFDGRRPWMPWWKRLMMKDYKRSVKRYLGSQIWTGQTSG